MSSQRILCVFGMIARRIVLAGREGALDPESESFVPDMGHVLRAVFAFFRKEMTERGLRDGVRLLGEAAMCRQVLKMLGTVPSLVQRVAPEASEGMRGSGVWERAGPGRDAQAVKGDASLLRVATWNIAGGHRSSQAPATFNERDQRAAVMAEVQR